MRQVTADLLEEITQRLVAEFQPEEVILFGSHAWGIPGDDSDLDLLVIVAASDLSPTRRAVQAHRALSGLGVANDILVKTRAEFYRYRPVYASLERQIAEGGRVLYGRG